MLRMLLLLALAAFVLGVVFLAGLYSALVFWPEPEKSIVAQADEHAQGLSNLVQATIGIAVSFAGALVAIQFAQLSADLLKRQSRREHLEHTERLLNEGLRPIKRLTQALDNYWAATQRLTDDIVFARAMEHYLTERDRYESQDEKLTENFVEIVACRNEIRGSIGEILATPFAHHLWQWCVQHQAPQPSGSGSALRPERLSLYDLSRELDRAARVHWPSKAHVDMIRAYHARHDALPRHQCGPSAIAWAGQFLLASDRVDGFPYLGAVTLADLIAVLPTGENLVAIIEDYLKLKPTKEPDERIEILTSFCHTVAPAHSINPKARAAAVQLAQQQDLTMLPTFPWEIQDAELADAGRKAQQELDDHRARRKNENKKRVQ